jgi:Trm5-related predicted tRNA methylase
VGAKRSCTTAANENESKNDEQQPVPVALSKNKQRKLRNYQKRLASRQYRRQRDREVKKCKPKSPRAGRPHQEEKLQAEAQFKEAQAQGPKVVIDCQYNVHMTLKEQKRFAQQLRRAYSSNKASPLPAYLYFTSLFPNSDFYSICCQINDGFPNYFVEQSNSSVLELFSSQTESLVYLTPDSPNTLETLDPEKIYVIGGLVDETTHKNLSYNFTKSKSLVSAKLPIQEYFTRGDQGTYKTVLTVNQVFDIILKWYQTKDWTIALEAGLPKRSGFIPIAKPSKSKEAE